MQFCQNHWDKLKQAIRSRGLNDFVSKDGKEMIDRQRAELDGAKATKETFDPLMAAHWMIVHNAADVVQSWGINPLIVLVGDPSNPVTECPICCLNWLYAEHDRNCTDPNCKSPKGQTAEWMLDKAADSAVEILATLPSQ